MSIVGMHGCYCEQFFPIRQIIAFQKSVGLFQGLHTLGTHELHQPVPERYQSFVPRVLWPAESERQCSQCAALAGLARSGSAAAALLEPDDSSWACCGIDSLCRCRTPPVAHIAPGIGAARPCSLRW